MSDAAPAPKRQKKVSQASQVRLDPTEDGSALRVSFTVSRDALKQSDLIDTLLQRDEGFSIEADTPGVLMWVAARLQGGQEQASRFGVARDHQQAAELRVRSSSAIAQ